jgi:ADP-heptose:LPS heptosyltransferase
VSGPRGKTLGTPRRPSAALAGEWRRVRRLLAVRLDNLGDVIMTGPALRALKAGLPECRITMLTSPGGARAAELLPWVDEVIAHRALWQDLGSLPFDPEREAALVRRLAEGRFDAGLIFTSFSQTPHAAGYACYLAGIPLRLGASKEFGGGVLSHELRCRPEEDGVHQVDRNLALLEPFGFDCGDSRLELAVPDSARASLDRLLRGAGVGLGERLVVAAPWASCPARTYPPAAMLEACLRLGEELGWRVALTGPENRRQEAASLLAAGAPGVLDLVGRLSFAQFAALVDRAALLLCNNSGPMHLAEASGTPAVVLYAGTELESQWRPRHAPARLLNRPTPCRPCYLFDCPVAGHPCLAVPVAEVAAAGLELAAMRITDAAPA